MVFRTYKRNVKKKSHISSEKKIFFDILGRLYVRLYTG